MMATPGAIDQVLVPRSRILAPENPRWARKLVSAVNQFVGRMTKLGYYTRHELPRRAIQTYRTSLYHGQLWEGRHASIAKLALTSPRFDYSIVLNTLATVGATAHLEIAEKMSDLLTRYPSFESLCAMPDGAHELEQLDHEFIRLDRRTPIDSFLAPWIAAWPELRIVDDIDYAEMIQRLAELNPSREIGLASKSVGELTRKMLDRREMGLALACTQMPRSTPGIEVKLLAAMLWSVEIDGQPQVVTHVRTNKELRYGLVTDAYTALYERIEVKPFREEEKLLDSVKEGRYPRPHDAIVGKRLSYVPAETIDEWMALTRNYRIPVAVDMLLRRIDMSRKELFVFPIRTRVEAKKIIVRWGAVNTHQAVTIEVGPTGAIISSDPDGKMLATISTGAIEAWVHAMENLEAKLDRDSARL